MIPVLPQVGMVNVGNHAARVLVRSVWQHARLIDHKARRQHKLGGTAAGHVLGAPVRDRWVWRRMMNIKEELKDTQTDR